MPPEQDFPEDPKLFKEILSSRERMTASILNIKENAQYEKRELITGQQWFSASTGGAIKTNYSFRDTYDLVSLNGGPIPPGVTTINIPTDPAVNTPIVISYNTSLTPVHGFGGATIGTTYYFINDPQIFVRYINTSTTVQQIQVNNTTGSNITQMYWVFEYLKN